MEVADKTRRSIPRGGGWANDVDNGQTVPLSATTHVCLEEESARRSLPCPLILLSFFLLLGLPKAVQAKLGNSSSKLVQQGYPHHQTCTATAVEMPAGDEG